MKKYFALILAAALSMQIVSVPVSADDTVKDTQIKKEDYINSFNEYIAEKRKYIPVLPKKSDIAIDGDTATVRFLYGYSEKTVTISK